MSESKTILFPNAKPGETFMIGDMKFIRFHNINGQTPVVMKSIAFTSPFGNSNDLRSSDILKKLQEDILPKIAEEVGEENICEFETDLTCLDGMKPYGTMKSRISLPTGEHGCRRGRLPTGGMHPGGLRTAGRKSEPLEAVRAVGQGWGKICPIPEQLAPAGHMEGEAFQNGGSQGGIR